MIRNILEQLLDSISLQREKAMEELLKLPDGNLIIRNRRGRKYYSLYENGKETGITRNKILVENLIYKTNIRNNLKYLNSVYRILNNAISKMPSRNYSFSDYTDWETANFERNPYKPEKLKYRTNHGELVRSKSEKIIADALYSMSIPFRYESALVIGNQIVYPDFQILKPTGEIVIWEHLGLMENQDYYINAVIKMTNYRKFGYYQHKNLICTWEEDLYDTLEIKKIIEKFILC